MHEWFSRDRGAADSSGFPFATWYAAIEAHSRQHVTDIADQLPAIAGVATLMNAPYNQTCLAGLCLEDLVWGQGLGWYKGLPGEDVHPRANMDTHANGHTYLAPSWSWSSHPNGFVTHMSRAADDSNEYSVTHRSKV